MRIVIATSVAPFVDGGSTCIVESLGSELKARSHDVEILRFPFSEDYAEVLHQLLALRLFDLSQDCDRLITIRTPSHLLKHPNKIAWFIHHYRGAYDLWGTKYHPGGDGLQRSNHRRGQCRAPRGGWGVLQFGSCSRPSSFLQRRRG